MVLCVCFSVTPCLKRGPLYSGELVDRGILQIHIFINCATLDFILFFKLLGIFTNMLWHVTLLLRHLRIFKSFFFYSASCNELKFCCLICFYLLKHAVANVRFNQSSMWMCNSPILEDHCAAALMSEALPLWN